MKAIDANATPAAKPRRFNSLVSLFNWLRYGGDLFEVIVHKRCDSFVDGMVACVSRLFFANAFADYKKKRFATTVKENTAKNLDIKKCARCECVCLCVF